MKSISGWHILFLLLLLQIICLVYTTQFVPDEYNEVSFTDRRPTFAPTGVVYNLPPTEFNALKDFYDALNGPHWEWYPEEEFGYHWNFSYPNANPCVDKWQGIKCGSCYQAETCSIILLSLDQQNLTGSFPTSLSSLTNLEAVALSRNNITGMIPESFWKIKGLTSVNFIYNALSGTLPPAVGSLRNLTELYISHNDFHGTLPEELYLMTGLNIFEAYSNRLEGTLSSRIGMLRHLFTFLVDDNLFHGTLPNSIGNLTRLNSLGISHNFLTSTIPDSFGGLTSLSLVDLTGNLLTGPLPLSIARVDNLVELALASNTLNNSIPFESFLSTRLRTVDLGLNCFSGSISDSVTSLSSLERLYLDYNLLTGSIPTQFDNLVQLVTLDLYNNYFCGNVAKSFVYQHRMTTFDMSNNLFTGSLPNGQWPNLLYYLINKNFIDGTIPMALSNLTLLNYFDISDNMVQGSIPSFLLNLRGMKYLYLNNNQLTGKIVLENRTFISELYLNYNQLRGSLPSNIEYYLPNLVSLNLQSNQFTGSLPTSLFQLYDLQVLFVQNNQFTGPVPLYANITIGGEVYRSSFTNVDLSSNQFTGPLPINSLVGSKFLSSFAAASNCFDASISSEVCSITTLTCLALDGIATATNCRSKIFPHLKSEAFTITNYMNRQYPLCLFTMPQLQSLHLSGNRLIGSLPSDLMVTPTLTDLVLSHNLMTGTIPSSIQRRPWANLDLSYNRFKGSLVEDFPSIADNSCLSLSVNRLSGVVPNSLKYSANISILEGNLFECNEERSDLPVHDPDESIYNCGSDTVNRSLFLWIAALSIPFDLLLCFYFCVYRANKKEKETAKLGDASNADKSQKQSAASSFKELLEQSQMYFWEYNRMLFGNNSLTDSQLRESALYKDSIFARPSDMLRVTEIRSVVDKDEVHFLLIFFMGIRKVVVYSVAFIFVVLCPVYAVISYFNCMYSYEYAWNISALYLSGKTPGLTMFFGCVMAIGIIHATFENAIFAKYRRFNKRRVQSSSTKKPSKPWNMRRMLTLTLVAVINFTMMIWLDILYVFVTINASTSVIAFVQILLAMVKVFWNEVFLWNAIPRMWRVTSCLHRGTHNVASSTYSRSSKDLTFIVFNVIMNNLLLPSLAVAAVSKNCFYNTIVAPPSVEASYSYTTCNKFVLLFHNGYYCYDEGSATGTSSYSPPYLYTYQCSSTVIVNYVAIYIYVFLLLGVLLPSIRVFGKLYLDYLEARQARPRVQDFLRVILPANLKLNISPESAVGFRDTVDTAENPMTNSLDHGSITTTEEGMASMSQASTDSFGNKSSVAIIFDRDRLLVRLNSFFGIILTYGVLFPPLALIGTVAAVVVTYYEQTFVIGRTLWIANERQCYLPYRQQINVEARFIAERFLGSIYIVAPFASIVYAYLIFDTIGDETGWKAAMGPAIVLLFVSPIFYSVLGLISLTKKKLQDRAAKEKNLADKTAIELMDATPNSHPSKETKEAGEEETKIECS